MPTIGVSYADICRLVGRRIPKHTLEEALMYAKGEIEAFDGDALKIDIKDTNRPDLWSAEGIAREIRYRYDRNSMASYAVKKSGIEVHVDPHTKGVRPAVAAAVVRDLRIDAHVLSQLIQLQEKISQTFGKRRREVAIGVYELDRLAPPIRYTVTAPRAVRFIPLGFTRAMTPKEILEEHPKGKEYGHLISSSPLYPLWTDTTGAVLSLPPIINSEMTGRVTTQTQNIFIECSGQSDTFVLPALAVLVAACIDRGGSAQSVDIVYQDRRITTPDFSPKTMAVDLNSITRVSGLQLTVEDAKRLLLRSGYAVRTAKGSIFTVEYPPFRQDIMHPIDVVEDVIISFGYNAVPPEPLAIFTKGRQLPSEAIAAQLADVAIGLGFQEVMNYTLSNKDTLVSRMNQKKLPVVEIANPASANWSVFRTALLPGLLNFLVSNQHVDYPQRLFEMGLVVMPDQTAPTRARDVRKLCLLISDAGAGYEHISAVLQAFMRAIAVPFSLKSTRHPSFIEGRTAMVVVDKQECGVIGEVHPQVLTNFGIEMPTVAVELNGDLLVDVIKRKR